MQSFIQYLKETKAEKENGLLEEMARLGYIDDKRLEIIVFTDDSGNKPHFHIRDAFTKGQKFHTYIEIKHPRYFHHTGKEGILNGKMKKKLMEFFSLPNEDFEGMSNWQVLLRMWNSNNSSSKVLPTLEIPNYKEL